MSADHHVPAVIEIFLHLMLCTQNILRITSQRICRHTCDHASYHIFRILLMSKLYRSGACHKLIVKSCIRIFQHLFRSIRNEILHHQLTVDLIECKPVSDQSFIFFKDHFCIFFKRIHQLTVRPSA